jgi:hypothetical protein
MRGTLLSGPWPVGYSPMRSYAGSLALCRLPSGAEMRVPAAFPVASTLTGSAIGFLNNTVVNYC